MHYVEHAYGEFRFPTWSLLRYAGDMLWSYEEDSYNPAEAGVVIAAWRAAGGEFAAPESVGMKTR